MKKKTLALLIALIAVCTVLSGAFIIRARSSKPITPDMTEPSANAQKVVYNDDTPDFTFKAKKEEEFSSREDVYEEYYRLDKAFTEFTNKYEESWTEAKSDKNHEIYREYLNLLYCLLEDKFSKKSDSDILSEKEDLISLKMGTLSDNYIFPWECADIVTDKEVKESYRNLAEEKKRIYLEAEKYYKEYEEGKHTIDDVLDYLGATYDETENVRYIPMKYVYGAS